MYTHCVHCQRALGANEVLEADWVELKCGNYNTETKTCGAQ